MVAIESMKERPQAWHVDSPLPHVKVNLLYLTTGPAMTQFMSSTDSIIGSFEELTAEQQKELMDSPFNPISVTPAISKEWREYIKTRLDYFYYFILYLLTLPRYSYLLAPPEYLQESGMFSYYAPPSSPVLGYENQLMKMNAGEAIWFPADSVCHRGVPSKTVAYLEAEASKASGKKRASTANATMKNPPPRKLLFWFSWEKDLLPPNHTPDIDFQMNPWTVYSVVNENLNSLVYISYFNFFIFALIFIIRGVHYFSCSGGIILHTASLRRRKNY